MLWARLPVQFVFAAIVAYGAELLPRRPAVEP